MVCMTSMLNITTIDVFSQKAQVMDATRTDGSLVAIKSVPDASREVEIAQFLTSVRHPDNHCVPVLDVIPDPLYPSRSLLVMPYLRPFDDPELTVVGDAVDFVSQMLEV